MDVEVSKEMIWQKVKGRYQSIYDWFVGKEGQENEAGKLFDATNDIIRRITRYAAQLSEKNALGANRKRRIPQSGRIIFEMPGYGRSPQNVCNGIWHGVPAAYCRRYWYVKRIA